MKKTHLYHMVDVSPWPLSASIAVFLLTSGMVCYMHRVVNGMLLFFLGLFILILTLFVWWRDIVRESTYQGNYIIIV